MDRAGPAAPADGEKLAARIREHGADILIVESDFVHGPVFDCDLRVIGSCRGDPNNVDIAGRDRGADPGAATRRAATPTRSRR